MKAFLKDLVERLSSRKLWGCILVTGITVYNAWEIEKRALTAGEIVTLSGIWGVYNVVEGKADIETRKGTTSMARDA